MLGEGRILHVLLQRTCTEYCRILDIEYQRGLVRAYIIAIVQGEHFYILLYNKTKHHGTSPYIKHTLIGKTQPQGPGSKRHADSIRQSILRIPHKCRNDGHDSSEMYTRQRCLLSWDWYTTFLAFGCLGLVGWWVVAIYVGCLYLVYWRRWEVMVCRR